MTNSAMTTPTRRWIAACYFDFNLVNAVAGPVLTAPNQRAYFRLRSDSQVYFVTIPLDHAVYAEHASADTGYWQVINQAVDRQFARYLTEDKSPKQRPITEHEFWQEVGRHHRRLGALDPLVTEVAGGHGNVDA